MIIWSKPSQVLQTKKAALLNIQLFLKYWTPSLPASFGCSRGSSHFPHAGWGPLQHCSAFLGCDLAFKCHWFSGTVSTMRRLSHWVLGFLRARVIKEILLPFELKHFPELPSLPWVTLSIWGRALKYLHQHCQKQPCIFPSSYAPFSKSPKAWANFRQCRKRQIQMLETRSAQGCLCRHTGREDKIKS